METHSSKFGGKITSLFGVDISEKVVRNTTLPAVVIENVPQRSVVIHAHENWTIDRYYPLHRNRAVFSHDPYRWIAERVEDRHHNQNQDRQENRVLRLQCNLPFSGGQSDASNPEFSSSWMPLI